MILSIAISLLALSKPIHVSAKATRGRNLAKSDKEAHEGSRSVGGGASSLELYSYTPPAVFSGMYSPCFASITRNSASDILSGTYHYCPKDTDDVLHNFVEDLLHLNITSKDAFGAYFASNEFVLEEDYPPDFFGGYKMTPWEGQARGNMLFMDTYGAGSTSAVGVLERPNDTPDHKECKLFQSSVLECLTTLVEYCTLVEGADESVFCEGKEGQWQYTYEIWLVSAQDLDDCPVAPGNFCESNPISAAGAFARHLEDEAEQDEEERATCPLLRK